jgi:predicted HTH domain antitoxin
MNLAATVRAGLYANIGEALQEAVKTWLAVRPNIRLEVAVELFRSNEVTIDRAAEIAGLNRWLFQDILMQRGIHVQVEVDSSENLKKASIEIRDS